MEKNINQEIEQTLKALDDVQQVEVNPYLYTRMKAKMDQSMGTPINFSFPFFKIALIMLLVSNVLVGIYAYKVYNPKTDITEIITQEFNLRFKGDFQNL